MTAPSETPSDPFARLRVDPPKSVPIKPRSHVLKAIRAEMDKHPEPRRTTSRATRLALSSMCLLVGLIVTSMGILARQPSRLLLLGSVVSVAIGALCLSGVAPGRAGRFDVGVRRALLAGLGVAAVAGLGVYADYFLPAQEFFGGGHGAGALHCAGQGLLTGAVCSAGLIYLWRSTDPFTPGLTGALLGAFGALLGVLTLGVGCPSLEGWHLVLGHGTSVLFLAGVGWIAGRKWLAP